MFKVVITEMFTEADDTGSLLPESIPHPIERVSLVVDIIDIGAVIQAATKKPRERRKDAGTSRKEGK